MSGLRRWLKYPWTDQNHDVTAGYIIMDVERLRILRIPMQQITDHLFEINGR